MAFSISNHRLAGQPYVPSPNLGGPLRAKFLVIHYTASGPGFDAAAYFARPGTRASAHLVIRRDGTIIQCVRFNRIAWHAGRSRWTGADGTRYANLNQYAIGIELENWGALKPSTDGWLSWSGQDVAGEVLKARHGFGTPDTGWEPFTPAQVEAACLVARALCPAYGISEVLGHDDISPGRKSDPGPAWDMAAFRRQVFATV